MKSIGSSEVTLAFRLMRRQPVLTIVAILSLATGIGMATTGFTLLDAVLHAELPFSGGERFVLVDVSSNPEAVRADLDDTRFRILREGASVLRHLGASRNGAVNLLLPAGEVVSLDTTFMTPDSFSVLPFVPLLGRTLNAEDARPGAPAAVLIRESLWRRHFSADPFIVGTPVNLGGTQRIVAGVMPDSFEFPSSAEVWVPIDTVAGARIFGVLEEEGAERLATEQLTALSRQYEAQYSGARALRLEALPYTRALLRGLDLLSAALVGVLLLVLLVIAANVANLVLARTLSRSQELAVRTALGATRWRLVGQIFMETLALGGIAAALGLAASQAALRQATLTFTELPFWLNFSASPRTMAFVVAATLLTAAIGGVLPALKATRRDSAPALSSGNRIVSHGFGRVSAVLIAAQIALSIAFLNMALVTARGVSGYLEGTPSGLPEQLVTARLVIDDSVRTTAGYTGIVSVLRNMPGVTGAGLATSLPRLSPAAVMTSVRDGIGEAASVPRAAPAVEASVGFLETLGASASTGRFFQPGDFEDGAPPVAIVNEPFVARFFGGANPVGRQLRIIQSDAPENSEPWREIIGVAPDLGLSAGDASLAAGYYIPMKDESFFHAILHAPGGATPLSAQIPAALARLDPRIRVRDVIPLEAVGSEDRAFFAGFGATLSALGGIAFLLSLISVYAILSYSVTQRAREIAIRSALGATRAQILWAVMARSSAPLVLGVVAGYPLGALLVEARVIFAFRLPAGSGPWGLPALCLLMIVAGLLSFWAPARRALRISASDALKS